MARLGYPEEKEAEALWNFQLNTNKRLFRGEEDREFAEEDLRDLKLNTPGLYQQQVDRNTNANLKMQEMIAFDMDRFREEGDPWTQAGMKDLPFHTSVPFGSADSSIPTRRGAANGLTRRNLREPSLNQIYLAGKDMNPYTAAHEGRHYVVKGRAAAKEENANRYVDRALANKFGNEAQAKKAHEFIVDSSRNNPKNKVGFDTIMNYQKTYGAPEAFSQDYENEPDIIKGKEKFTSKDANVLPDEQLYELYKRANQFDKTPASIKQGGWNFRRDHPDVGVYDTIKNWF